MKKLMAFLLSLTCLFAVAACGDSAANPDGSNDETIGVQDGTQMPDPWGITLTAKNVTAQGMTLSCAQRGGRADGNIETGSEYWIEKRENGGWVKVQPLVEPVWDMMAHFLPSGGDLEWELDWTWLYGELGAGTYRICKNFMVFKESGASEGRNYCAEFEIK